MITIIFEAHTLCPLHHVADRLRALQVGCAVSGRLRGSVRRASGLVLTGISEK